MAHASKHVTHHVAPRSAHHNAATASRSGHAYGYALALLALAVFAVLTLSPNRHATQKLDPNEPPPSLRVAEQHNEGLQGSYIDPTHGYIQYQPNDHLEFTKSLPSLKVENPLGTFIPAGTNYLFTDKETTMGKIFRGIDPAANRLILAYYSSGEYGRAQGFYTFARGSFTDAHEITIQDVNTFIIPANRGVVVMNERDTTSYGLTTPLRMTSTALSTAANSAPLAEGQGGWVLLPSNTAKISNMIALYADRVVSAWTLSSGNTFVKVENFNTFAMTKYFLVWLKLAPKNETAVKEQVLAEYIKTGATTNQWFEGSLLSNTNGDYVVELSGKLENTVSDPTYYLKLSTTDKTRLSGKKSNVASLTNPRFADLDVNQLVIVKSPKTGRHWNAKILEKKSNGTLSIGYKDENYAVPVNVTTSDIYLTMDGKMMDGTRPPPATATTATHEENLKSLSKYLKWQRVNGSESQDPNTGDLTVTYRIYVDNYQTLTEKNLRVDILRNPHAGSQAWQIVHEGPYNLQVINGNVTFANGTPATPSTFTNLNDGSLLVKVLLPFPGIPMPGNGDQWGKVDTDFAFSDSANTPITSTSKYVTNEFARPNPTVAAGDGEVIFQNLGAGMVPVNYFKKIVFYSSGGENATSLNNIFKDKTHPWTGGQYSNWYNLDVGSKNWLLYDEIGHDYDEDTKGHAGLPTIYSAVVPSKDQDWKF